MKKRDRRTTRAKVSAMVLKVAQGYIDLGKTIQEKESLLRSACTAWNIACQPPSEIEKALKAYVNQFRQINYSTEIETKNFESDIKQLIEQKLNLYPGVNMPIIDCKMELFEGKEKAYVMFIR